MEQEEEEWRPVVGYEGLYEVSSMGRVRSLDRIVKAKGNGERLERGKLIKAVISKNGYERLTLCFNGVKRNHSVHQLVACAYLNHKSDGWEKVVNHKNHIKNQNNVSNLEIVSQRENANRKHCKSSSKYVGVSFNNTNNKWGSHIHVNKRKILLGHYDKEIYAHLAYQKALKQHLNGEKITRENVTPKKPKTSKYKMIYFRKDSNKWAASFKNKGKVVHLGLFKSESIAYKFQQKKLKELEL